MGNKSKQRTGKSEGLSWRQVKQKFPKRFLHKPQFALASRSIADAGVAVDPEPPHRHYEFPVARVVPFEPRAKSPPRERATDRIDARRARRGPQTRREKRALTFQGKF